VPICDALGRRRDARLAVSPHPSSVLDPQRLPVRALDRKRILIVDDVVTSGEALRELLELAGADVTLETSSVNAVRRTEETPFDALICDIAMPGFDGYAMLRRIREMPLNAQTPAIAYSGYSGPSDRERARGAGFGLHLTKPVDVESLIEAILSLTGRRTAVD